MSDTNETLPPLGEVTNDFLDNMIAEHNAAPVFLSHDRGFVGRHDDITYAYTYKIEQTNYGYLEATFEINKLGCRDYFSMSNSVSALGLAEYEKKAQENISNSLSDIDSLIHVLQNYRRELLIAIGHYQTVRADNIKKGNRNV
jgi:hypothetical protein